MAAQTVQFVYANRRYTVVLENLWQVLSWTKIILPDGTIVRKKFGRPDNGAIIVEYHDVVFEGVPLRDVARDQKAVLAAAA